MLAFCTLGEIYGPGKPILVLMALFLLSLYLKCQVLALAGVAQWTEWPAWEPKGRRFDSESGHMPGLRTRSPVGGVQEATTH